MTYSYDLPTTGTISFPDFALDTTDEHAYTAPIAEATQARANMRGVLKQSRRTDSEHRDHLRIIKVCPANALAWPPVHTTPGAAPR